MDPSPANRFVVSVLLDMEDQGGPWWIDTTYRFDRHKFRKIRFLAREVERVSSECRPRGPKYRTRRLKNGRNRGHGAAQRHGGACICGRYGLGLHKGYRHSTARPSGGRDVGGSRRASSLYTSASAIKRGESDRRKRLHVIVHGLLTRDVNAPDNKKLPSDRPAPSFPSVLHHHTVYPSIPSDPPSPSNN